MDIDQGVFKYYMGDTDIINGTAIFSDTLKPLDLTDCTEISVVLPNAGGTSTVLLLSLSQVEITTPALLGGWSAPVSATLWPMPNPGELQTFFVTFTTTSIGVRTAAYFISVLQG